MLVLPRTELTLLILIIAHEVQVFGVADGRGQSENIIERLKKAIFKI